MSRLKVIDSNKFDYSKFYRDLLTKLKKEKTDLATVSTKRLFHASNYLAEGLRKKRLPFQVVLSLAEWYELNMADYEIKPEPIETSAANNDNAWSCEVKVEEEFGTLMMRISKGDQTVTVGRSGLYGLDDMGIVQSISYAAHMCYKLAQQDFYRKQGEPTASKETKFKDWVKKYEQNMPPYGTFARYVKDNYAKFPAYGRKEMKVFLNMNNGTAHINTFEVLFSAYLDWYKGQRQHFINE